MGIRRKVSEISGVCLFLLTHLNHELTRAAHELRVWLTRIVPDSSKPRKNIPVLVSITDRNSEYLKMHRTYAQ